MKIKLGSLLFSMAYLLLASWTHANTYDEGIEYQLIVPPVRTSNPDKVEVVEMFWYGCPHCYSLEPKLLKWKAKLPSNVEFIRIPAILKDRQGNYIPEWETHARAFYTAELLGVLDKMHESLFKEIHHKNKKLVSKPALAKFFSQYGISQADFNATFDSFGVLMKVNRAKDLTERYGTNGVPTLVVNGRYKSQATLTNGQDELLKLVDFLIKKESKTP